MSSADTRLNRVAYRVTVIAEIKLELIQFRGYDFDLNCMKKRDDRWSYMFASNGRLIKMSLLKIKALQLENAMEGVCKSPKRAVLFPLYLHKLDEVVVELYEQFEKQVEFGYETENDYLLFCNGLRDNRDFWINNF